jgi:NAD(P) transhydrogenase subunit alpha
VTTTTLTVPTKGSNEIVIQLPAHKGDFQFLHAVTSQSPSLIVFEVTILVLAIFLGIEVISKVPTMLHTPLMSGTNAIHGIVIVGAILVAASDHPGWLMKVIGFIAVVLATANVVGGFVVTDRMLEMFKPKQQKKPDDEA